MCQANPGKRVSCLDQGGCGGCGKKVSGQTLKGNPSRFVAGLDLE